MTAIKELYMKALDGIGEMPSWKKDWRWIAIYSVCIYAIVLAFRMSFAGRWDHPEFWVNGERILATHDAYFWLAKAKGVSTVISYPLAKITAVINDWFGIGYGTIAFWSPAIMGALVGVVCFLWGWFLAGTSAGILAGIIGSLTPGFYYRSRLGYFDTDMFTLLAPMAIAWMLAYWASKHITNKWFWSEPAERIKKEPVDTLWLAFGFGILSRFGAVWHADILNVSVLFYFFSIAFVLFKANPGHRIPAIYELCIFFLAAFPGTAHGSIMPFPTLWSFLYPWIPLPLTIFSSILGISMAYIMVLGLRYMQSRNLRIVNNPFVCAFVCIALIYLTNIISVSFPAIAAKLAGYFNQAGTPIAPSVVEAVGPIYPSVVQSIIEAKLVPITEILERGVFSAWVGWLALFFSLFVVAVRPTAVFLLPLVVLHLASIKLGVRFSMFGGAALCVFLGVGLYWFSKILLTKVERKEHVAVGIQCIVAVITLFYCYTAYSKIPLTPVITKQHAESLIELSEQAPKRAVAWSWWDWGYATQYYSGLRTVVDGGQHMGKDVYPVAYAMSSDSPERSNRMIAYGAQYLNDTMYGTGLTVSKQWGTIPRADINTVISNALSQVSSPSEAPQYLVVTWKDLTISKWITYFGNWNLETGSTNQASISNFQAGQLGFNMERGAVKSRKGGGGLVSDITMLSPEGVEKKEYYLNRLSPQLLPKTRHLLINTVSRQSVLMDRTVYRSTMQRLLTGDPNDPEISKYFKLVVDKLPFARIYEVVQ